MEITRLKLRHRTVKQFKYIRTCILARELCLLVRTNRVALNPKDAHAMCTHVSILCRDAGCTEPSELCEKAANAALTNEQEYLKICNQSCLKCGQARRPPATQATKATYVA
jgi:hypothetical protein